MRTISMLALIIMMTSLSSIAHGQVFGAVGGIRVGESFFLEAGFGMGTAITGSLGKGVRLGGQELLGGVSVTGELAPFVTNTIYGGAGTLWLDLFPLSMATSIAYYTSNGEHALMLKPEFGIGVLGSRISYAHAFSLSGAEIEEINKNELVLRFFFPFVPVGLPRLGH